MAVIRVHPMASQQQHKLKKMPHIFERVLQLPVHRDHDVEISESEGCILFVVKHTGIIGNADVEMIDVVPGAAIKVVVGTDAGLGDDGWRFRLPVTTAPRDTRVFCDNETLVVTVPKQQSHGPGQQPVICLVQG